MISSISSFEIINVVCFAKSEGREANKLEHVTDSKMSMPASDATAVNSYCIEKLLPNG